MTWQHLMVLYPAFDSGVDAYDLISKISKFSLTNVDTLRSPQPPLALRV
jgi:hypothetical protein